MVEEQVGGRGLRATAPDSKPGNPPAMLPESPLLFFICSAILTAGRCHLEVACTQVLAERPVGWPLCR
jgi:hypothetical protein